MFGKLLKYEFRSIGKWYFALNAGVIAIAIVLSFTINTLTNNPDEVGLTTRLIALTKMSLGARDT